MIESMLEGLRICFQVNSLIYMVIGGAFGIAVGVLPGLGGTTGMILLIPLTFGMDPGPALILLMSEMVASNVGGSVTSILIGVPGEALSAATIFDGHPMAKQGRAAEAIGASAASSAYGGVFGALVFIVALPLLRKIVLLVGPPEILMLAIWGLTVIGALSGRSILNGLLSAFIGLMMSFVGFNLVLGGSRYTFGSDYLWDGLPMAAVFIGFFAISTVIDMTLTGVPIAAGVGAKILDATRQMLAGAISPFKHLGLFMRSSALGAVAGCIPGIGGVVTAFLAYGHAVQSAKDKSQFGKGDIRGVIAPESSNNSVQGGSLITALSFGIPGSSGSALLLAALILHGINPGPELLQKHMDLVWVLIWSLIITNILSSIVTCMLASQMAKLTQVKPVYLVPIILSACLIGAYSYQSRMEDVIIALAVGILGYLMKCYSIPVVPAVIGYILGEIMEKSFFQTLQIGRGSFAIFFDRPIAIVFAIVTVITLFGPFVKGAIKKRKTLKAALISQEQGGGKP